MSQEQSAQPDTKTFLFTDIENSTTLSEQYGGVMDAAREEHIKIIADVATNRDGHYFKTVGDATQFAFDKPQDALASAVEAQLKIAERAKAGDLASQLRSRMVLHTSQVDYYGEMHDYRGVGLNRAARLLAAGHGGQILVSLATQQLLRSYLPQGTTLKDLGQHPLKDLLEPEHIFQVMHDGLQPDFPPLITLDQWPNNLPRQQTPLIGREAEIASTCRTIRENPIRRLFTLLGEGGIGKTRLAIQVAAEMVQDFEDGAYFVALDTIPIRAANPLELVISEIARIFNLKEEGGQTLLNILKQYLKAKNLLLILDNFEHVLPASVVVLDLLRAAPTLKIIATSRVKLGIQGEQVIEIDPLDAPCPTAARERDPQKPLTTYSAVALFIDRALAVKQDFNVTNATTSAIADICCRVDKLPLAIELVAAQADSFSIQSLRSQLNEMLDSGGPDRPDRHKTLQRCIQWSYDLLTDDAVTLFPFMSVFQGGCTLETLMALFSDNTGLPRLAVIKAVKTLTDFRLTQLDETSSTARYTMLQTVQDFAGKLLQASGSDTVDRLYSAFIEHFLDLAEQADGKLRGSDQKEGLDRLEAEHANIRVALRWAIDHNKSEQSLRLSHALSRFWETRGYLTEGRTWLGQVLQLNTSTSTHKAEAILDLGWLVLLQGGISEAQAQFQSGLKMSQQLDYVSGIAAGWICLGIVADSQGDYAKALDYYQRSLTLHEELGDKSGIAACLGNLGNVAGNQGDYAKALDYYQRSLTLREELGDKSGIALCLGNLGIVANSQGDYAKALDYHQRSLTLREELGDKSGIAACLGNLGIVADSQGDYAKALDYHQRSLTLREELGDKSGIAACLIGLGNVADSQGDYAKALDYHQRSLTLHEELGDKSGIALCLGNLGNVAGNQGDYAKALDYYRRSLAISESIGAFPSAIIALENMVLTASRQGNHTNEQLYNERLEQLKRRIGQS
jgi:predicted ATPase/class 3 adenylate cyclase